MGPASGPPCPRVSGTLRRMASQICVVIKKNTYHQDLCRRPPVPGPSFESHQPRLFFPMAPAARPYLRLGAHEPRPWGLQSPRGLQTPGGLQETNPEGTEDSPGRPGRARSQRILRTPRDQDRKKCCSKMHGTRRHPDLRYIQDWRQDPLPKGISRGPRDFLPEGGRSKIAAPGLAKYPGAELLN